MRNLMILSFVIIGVSQAEPPVEGYPGGQHHHSSPSSRQGYSPNTPSAQYGAPRSISAEYGPPQSSDFGSGGRSSSYDTSKSLSTEYGVPKSLSSEYGAPRSVSQEYGVPKSEYGAPELNSVDPGQGFGLPEIIAARRSIGDHGSSNGVTQAIIGGANSRSSGSHAQSPGALRSSSGTPSQQYGPPQQFRSSPSQQYGPPTQQASSFRSSGGVSNDYLPPNARAGAGSGYNYGRAGDDGGEEEDNEYGFEYQVNDYQSESDFGHKESHQDGSTQGMYHVVLPDGRKQVVEYEADDRGFKPKISYEEPTEEFKARHSGGYDSNAQGYPDNSLGYSSKSQGYSAAGRSSTRSGSEGPY